MAGQRKRVVFVVRAQGFEIVLGLLLRRCRGIDHGQVQPIQQLDEEQAGHAAVEVFERMNVQKTALGKGEVVDEAFAGDLVQSQQSRFEIGDIIVHQHGDLPMRRRLMLTDADIPKTPSSRHVRR